MTESGGRERRFGRHTDQAEAEFLLHREAPLGRLRSARRDLALWLYRGTIAWPVRLASWALVGIPIAFLFDPMWVPLSVLCVEAVWIGGMQWSWFRTQRAGRAREAEAAERRRDAFRAFGVVAVVQLMHSGQSIAWRAGDLVFKASPSREEWTWLGEHLPTVREDGFRLALPVPSTDGRWVVDGWCAQTAVAGEHPRPPRWLEVLELCERFHRQCAHLPRPGFVERRTHPWAVGDRVAWGEAAPSTDDPQLARLLTLRRPVSLPSQVIHGDLTDNVLFADGMAPAVIDPTPYWRPAGFAIAIIVHDAVHWFGADPEPLISATTHVEEFPQLLVRAAIYRMVTSYRFGSVSPTMDERTVDLVARLAK